MQTMSGAMETKPTRKRIDMNHISARGGSSPRLKGGNLERGRQKENGG